jgi:hypothetical protein
VSELCGAAAFNSTRPPPTRVAKIRRVGFM